MPEKYPSGAKRAAEKGVNAGQIARMGVAGAEARIDNRPLAARDPEGTPPCPCYKAPAFHGLKEFSAACKAHDDFAALTARLKSCPFTRPSFSAAFKGHGFLGLFGTTEVVP